MGKFKDLSGQKFGKLEVIEIDHRSENTYDELGRVKRSGVYYYRCKCDCGNIKIAEGRELKRGNVKSCGCYNIESHTKHGKRNTRIYRIYHHMIDRCKNKNDANYKDYGMRGIEVCEEWTGEQGFENFYKWSMENGYSEELTIDRINVNGNYEPNNCRWTDNNVQANNKRNNRVFDVGTGEKTLAQLCREFDKTYNTVLARLKRNWTIERALEIVK